MGANTGSKRLPWLAMAAAALAAVVLVVFLRSDPPASPAAGATPGATPATNDTGFSPSNPRPAIAESTAPGDPSGATAAGDDQRGNEHPVDLARLREKIPDNLYWRLDAPTQDAQILQARAEEKQRWNTLFGKVQSGTATEEEVRQYYAHRRQLSEDYIEFAKLILAEYGAQLPEQERGMYELGIRMHGTRLGEIPRQIEQALARKALQDQRREQWRRNR